MSIKTCLADEVCIPVFGLAFNLPTGSLILQLALPNDAAKGDGRCCVWAISYVLLTLLNVPSVSTEYVHGLLKPRSINLQLMP